ncbi:MAG: nucleotidyltransferase domain-containing protein [bacterium]
MKKDFKKAIATIKKELYKDPKINAAYLFGSYAEGTANENSDIDIGVVLFADAKADLYYEGDLLDKFYGAGGFDKVEVLVANEKSPLFRYNIVSHQKLLFAKNDDERADFEVESIQDFFEAEPYLELSYQSAIESAEDRLLTRGIKV